MLANKIFNSFNTILYFNKIKNRLIRTVSFCLKEIMTYLRRLKKSIVIEVYTIGS